MPERPPILGIGEVVAERSADRLYEVKMDNGHVAFGVVARAGPHAPPDWRGCRVTVAFSPFDMSRCRIVDWLAG